MNASADKRERVAIGRPDENTANSSTLHVGAFGGLRPLDLGAGVGSSCLPRPAYPAHSAAPRNMPRVFPMLAAYSSAVAPAGTRLRLAAPCPRRLGQAGALALAGVRVAFEVRSRDVVYRERTSFTRDEKLDSVSREGLAGCAH